MSRSQAFSHGRTSAAGTGDTETPNGKARKGDPYVHACLMKKNGQLPVSDGARVTFELMAARAKYDSKTGEVTLRGWSYEQIAEMRELSRDTVIEHAKALRAAGVLTWEWKWRTGERRACERDKNVFTFHIPTLRRVGKTPELSLPRVGKTRLSQQSEKPPSNVQVRKVEENEYPATARGASAFSNDNGNGALSKGSSQADESSLSSKHPFVDADVPSLMGAVNGPAAGRPAARRQAARAGTDDAPRIGEDAPRTTNGASNGSGPSAAGRNAPVDPQAAGPREASRETCWTPFLAAWRHGKLSEKRAAKALAPMRREVGHVEALNRWTRYLDQTPPRYCSPERFAEMHSAWAPKAGAPDRRYPTAEEIDARMRCEAEDYEPAA